MRCISYIFAFSLKLLPLFVLILVQQNLLYAQEKHEISFTIEVQLLPKWEKTTRKAIDIIIEGMKQNKIFFKLKETSSFGNNGKNASKINTAQTDSMINQINNLSWRELSLIIQYSKIYTPETGSKEKPLGFEIRKITNGLLEPLLEIPLDNPQNIQFLKASFFTDPKDLALKYSFHDILNRRRDLMSFYFIQVNNFISNDHVFLDSLYQDLISKHKNIEYR